MSRKDQRFEENLILIFQSLGFKTNLNQKLHFFEIFWDKRLCGSQTQKSVQIFLLILNPVTNTEILTPELVGDQSEMVV